MKPTSGQFESLVDPRSADEQFGKPESPSLSADDIGPARAWRVCVDLNRLARDLSDRAGRKLTQADAGEWLTQRFDNDVVFQLAGDDPSVFTTSEDPPTTLFPDEIIGCVKVDASEFDRKRTRRKPTGAEQVGARDRMFWARPATEAA